MEKHFPPKFQEKQFHCIYCNVFSAQSWTRLSEKQWNNSYETTPIFACHCSHCYKISYWYNPTEVMLVPDASPAPPRHDDLPVNCHSHYDEAHAIVGRSPRAAAALLRLALQKLMIDLGESGKTINGLVGKGLPVEVQQALDICRVVGNHAVHPGEIELNDTPDIAGHLFEMINFIVEDRISRPKRVAALYARLPEKDRVNIEERNKKTIASKTPIKE